jgi:hypothetical protein
MSRKSSETWGIPTFVGHRTGLTCSHGGDRFRDKSLQRHSCFLKANLVLHVGKEGEGGRKEKDSSEPPKLS